MEVHTKSTTAVDSGRLQLPLSTSVLGSSHHFHGLGDLLDVLDGLQTNGDWKKKKGVFSNKCRSTTNTSVTLIYLLIHLLKVVMKDLNLFPARSSSTKIHQCVRHGFRCGGGGYSLHMDF